MKIVIMAAVAANRVIGQAGSLPWSYPEDLAFFKETTSGEGKVLLMGRKTYDSLPVGKVSGEKLTGRKLMVITSTFRYGEKNVLFNTDIESSLDFLTDKIAPKEIIVVGGASLYSYFLEHDLATDRILTEINKSFRGDTYFPKYSKSDWEVQDRTPLNKDAEVVHYKLKTSK